MKRRLLIVYLLAAIFGGLALPAQAHPLRHMPNEALLAQAQRAAASPAEAARIAKRRYGGKILKVDTINTQRGVIYRVKLLLDNGRVRTVTITGE